MHFKALKKQNKLNYQVKDEILYIDIECKEAEIHNECITYLIDPTPRDLQHIECIINKQPYSQNVIGFKVYQSDD